MTNFSHTLVPYTQNQTKHFWTIQYLLFLVADYVNATRAFHIIGLILLFAALAFLAYLSSRSVDDYKTVSAIYTFIGK